MKTLDSYYTEERIQGELHFCLALEIARSMLSCGLISLEEYKELYTINLETFSPVFAEIMPKSLDK
ncbi:SHOCT domain-containing protein [Megasphaera sp.]|jgi:hypothetical protein|uniref:SHOCT domain-containing protein n=1 Tax=Megasphaera sp. TaxID=2023260 RepID=UPI003FF00CB6